MLQSLRPLWPVAVIVAVVGLLTQAWQAHHDRQWGRQAAQASVQRATHAADAGPVLMISSRSCAVCAVARRWLAEHRVAHRECFVEDDPPCKARFEALGAVGTPTFVWDAEARSGHAPRVFTGFRAEPFSAWLKQVAAAAPGAL
jgi:glutaredoxin